MAPQDIIETAFAAFIFFLLILSVSCVILNKK